MNEEIKKKLIIDICYSNHNSSCYISSEPSEYSHYKSFFDKILDDLFNLDNKTVGNLTENETFFLRKKYGLLDDGKTLSAKEIASELNVSYSYVSQALLKGYRKLKTSIWKERQLSTFKDYLEKNQISALLDADISELISDNIYKKLSEKTGHWYFCSFRDLVNISSYELLSIPNFGLAGVEKLRDLLRQYNLSFANDIAIPENHRITKYDIRKILIYKFEVDEKFYNCINPLVDELYDLREEKVLPLGTIGTFLIRKICGILDNGIRPSLTQVKEDLEHRYKVEYTHKNFNELIASSFSWLHKKFEEYAYNEIMKLSKDEILPIKLRYFKFNRIFNEKLLRRLKSEYVYTFGDLLDLKKDSYRYENILHYYSSDELDQFLVFMVEERELTKEQLEEKRRKEREEQEKKEQERLEKEALIEKRKNELSKARNVLIGQREKIRIEMLRKMDYYDNQLNSVNEKIKKLENK